MAWKSRRYRMLRWSAILLFAGACFNAAASVPHGVVQALEFGSISSLFWLPTATVSGAIGVLTALIWWTAARILASAETAVDSPRPWHWSDDVPIARPAPAARETAATAAPPVTPFRGRMPRRSRRLRGLGTAVLVLELLTAGLTFAGLIGLAVRGWGRFFGPLWHLSQAGAMLGAMLRSVFFGLFIFAFTRLIARIGHAAAIATNVDEAKPIE